MPMLVRKADGNHSQLKVEGVHSGDYIIVDDLVSSGDTVRAIIDSISLNCKDGDEKPQPKAVVCYSYSYSNFRSNNSVRYHVGEDTEILNVYGVKGIHSVVA